MRRAEAIPAAATGARVRARRPRLIRPAACLLLGAITTVAVAWAPVPQRSGRASVTFITGPRQQVRIYFKVSAREDVTTITVSHAPEFDDFAAYYVGQSGLEGARDSRHMLPTTDLSALPVIQSLPARTTLPPIPDLGHAAAATTIRRGWPCRALKSSEHTLETWNLGRTQPVTARTVGRASTPLGAFPFIPVWPGFLLNTVVFASPWAIAFLALAAAGAARRRYRRRRGRCIACGYDLRGLSGAVCPECGASPR